MPRKFVEPDKDKIKEKLQEVGKELFTQYGLKKTGVSEIAKAVGIAQGSFYLFYSSKEELFADILMGEEQRIRQDLIERYWEEGRLNRQTFCEFLAMSVVIPSENPLLLQLFDSELMQRLFQKIPPDKQQEMFKQDADDLIPYIKQAQENGVMALYPPEDIVSLIRSVVLLALHRDEIGADRYTSTIGLMAELLANSLIIGEVGQT